MKDFEKIKKEKNEHTALILMMSVLGEKLSRIIELLESSNKTVVKKVGNKQIEEKPKVKVFYMPLTPEDYD